MKYDERDILVIKPRNLVGCIIKDIKYIQSYLGVFGFSIHYNQPDNFYCEIGRVRLFIDHSEMVYCQRFWWNGELVTWKVE